MAVYKDKNTGKWYFRVYVTDPITNKRFQVQRNGFELKRDATEAEARMLSEYKSKKINLTTLTYDDLVEEYLSFQKKRVKPTTYTSYVYMLNRHMNPFFSKTKINDITRPMLENWYNYIKKLKMTYEHKNKILSRLKNLFEYCEDQYNLRVRYLNTFPPFKASGKIIKQAKTIYNEKTFNKFIKSAANELEKTIFYTLFYTGARIGEVRALQWKDIKLRDNYIVINKQVTSKIPGSGSTTTEPKTESSIRNIQIPNILVKQLANWYNLRREKKGFDLSWQVFGDDSYISENRVRRMVKRISADSGTPYITLHEFRHSYTSMLYSKNIDPKIIQSQLGHSSVSITMDIYTHIQEEEAKKTIIDLFDK